MEMSGQLNYLVLLLRDRIKNIFVHCVITSQSIPITMREGYKAAKEQQARQKCQNASNSYCSTGSQAVNPKF
jgi:hypothetical protein